MDDTQPCDEVEGWTTMACHVDDPVIVYVLAIRVCCMLSEDNA